MQTPIFLQEMRFIDRVDATKNTIKEGFVANMRVPGTFYVNDALRSLILDELRVYTERGQHGGFLPAVKQIANVAALPGIVKVGRFCWTLVQSDKYVVKAC